MSSVAEIRRQITTRPAATPTLTAADAVRGALEELALQGATGWLRFGAAAQQAPPDPPYVAFDPAGRQERPRADQALNGPLRVQCVASFHRDLAANDRLADDTVAALRRRGLHARRTASSGELICRAVDPAPRPTVRT